MLLSLEDISQEILAISITEMFLKIISWKKTTTSLRDRWDDEETVNFPWAKSYPQVSNIRRTLVGNKIVDNSDVVGASPVGAAPTTSSFST